MEKLRPYNELTPEQEMKKDIDIFLDFLEKIWERFGDIDMDTGEKLANMHKVFNIEKIEQILHYLENIKQKAEALGNEDINKIFMPLDMSLFEYKLCFEENLNNLSEGERVNMGGRLMRAIASLVASRKFFSEK